MRFSHSQRPYFDDGPNTGSYSHCHEKAGQLWLGKPSPAVS